MVRASTTRRVILGTGLALMLVAALLSAWAPPASAVATFTVKNTGDAADLNLGDAICDTSPANGRQCSLRAAIQEANATAGQDKIIFDIGTDGGLRTIAPDAPLPTITEAVTIDGYTQLGASPNSVATGNNAVLRIQLNGTNAGGAAKGLTIEADGSVIRGLAINRFGFSGIEIDGSDNRVEGNFIGTSADGTSVLGNGADGIEVESGQDNFIGAATRAARNLISGNGTHGIDITGSSDNAFVQGNYIGTDVTGSVSLGNGSRGITISGSSTATIVGGTVSAARNVISGNGAGIGIVSSNGHLVQGNFIGTDATGAAALGNLSDGLLIQSDNNVIGGTTAGARNVISGNGDDGIQISALSSDNTIQGNRIGTTSGGGAAMGNAAVGIVVQTNANDNLIGGTVAGAGNLISGNGTGGIFVSGADGTRIQGNRIGTKADGSGDLGNLGDGVFITNALDGTSADDNLIGGTGGANVIAGNGFNGVLLTGIGGSHDVAGNVIRNNDFHGIAVSSDGNTIGGGNVIIANGGDGVAVTEGGQGNRIVSNQIFANAELGIDLIVSEEAAPGVTANDTDDPDVGANNLQNFPVISSATRSNSSGGTTIIGSLNSNPSQEFTIQFFLVAADPSNHGEAQVFIGAQNVTTNANGDRGFAHPVAGLAPGHVITATATNTTTGNTSEFALNRTVVPGP